MSSSKADRLAKVAQALEQRPATSNRSQAARSRAAVRKATPAAPVLAAEPPAAMPASKALTIAPRPAPPVVTPVAAEPLRELGKPYSITEWQARITQALKWFRVAKAEVQSRMIEESQAAKMIAASTQYARVTYGDNALVTLRPRSNAGLSLLHWALERAGVRIDLVDQYGDITDVRTVCPYCDAKVKRPCNESRSRNCANRSRGNR